MIKKHLQKSIADKVVLEKMDTEDKVFEELANKERALEENAKTLKEHEKLIAELMEKLNI